MHDNPWAPGLPDYVFFSFAEEAPNYSKDGNGHDPTPLPIAAVADAVAVSFTRYKSRGRLSKRYDLDPDDGKVIATGGTEMSRGDYETVTIAAADPPAVLVQLGERIDVFDSCEALGLGVVIDGQPPTGDIVTKDKYERCHDNPRSTFADSIPRAKSHFVYPANGLALLFCDGDEKDNLREILVELWPGFAEVACLVRPSASASVKDPFKGGPLKRGEHLFVLNDDPTKTKAVLQAILRLSWCVGNGRSKGWIALAKDGDPLVYGPVDVTVWGTERLIYEGEVTLGEGLERLPRNAVVIGGVGVLPASKLIAFANKHAPVKRFDELVEKAKNDPAFLARQAAVKAAYRAEHIEKAVARGEPREQVEREFDRVTKAKAAPGGGGVKSSDRIWRELSLHQTLYFTDGKPFTGADMAANPQAFHKKECADPVEGLDYQSRNPGIIYHQGGRIEIYSRAHGDRYAYFLPLFNMEDLSESLKGLIGGLVKAPDESWENAIPLAPGEQAPEPWENAVPPGSGQEQAPEPWETAVSGEEAPESGEEANTGTVTDSSTPELKPKKKKIPSPSWRECGKGGFPKPSLENARLAITTLDVVCRHDRFSDRILFGYGKNSVFCHTVEPVLGEVSDNGLKALRQLLSQAFGLDFGDQFIRDAVETLALANGFNPVADLLDKAEADWDKQPRLARMAADYMACEDTELNAMFMYKTMLAGVARVRHPGCKFDNIPVLEGPEGWNKSTAWRLLAINDEWFSDEKIIGKESREVQEQLGGVWIHENAELAGMKKADIDTVKAHASRQVDRARPAYGHYLKRQPRNSIEVGTTNAITYLMSQDGNRRFWPMRLKGPIDLKKLKADRLQLWGEAAHYQRKREVLTLPERLWEAAGVAQEARRVKDAWEDKLADLEAGKKVTLADGTEYQTASHVHRVDDQERVASMDLLEHVLKIPPGQQTLEHGRRLANAMKALGWQRPENDAKITINGTRVRGYFRVVGDDRWAKAD